MAENKSKKSLEKQYYELLKKHPELRTRVENLVDDDKTSLAQPSPYDYIESTTTAGVN